MATPAVPPPPGSPAPLYPLQLDLEAPDKIARWRPLVHWLLVIPHVVVLYVLLIVQRVVFVISFFAILFTGAMPEGLFGFNAMVLRYQWRVSSYSLFMRESYPEFAFATESADPATEPARLSVQPAPKLSRGLIFVKWLLAIPHYFVLFFLFIAVYVVTIIAFFAVIITGAWPEGMRTFVVGVMRWSARVNMYVLLMTDQYPPFSLS
jgi:hypothetical protein